MSDVKLSLRTALFLDASMIFFCATAYRFIEFSTFQNEWIMNSHFQILLNVFPEIVLVFSCVFLISRKMNISWKGAIGFIGIGRLNLRLAYVAFLALIPVMVFDFFSLQENLSLGIKYTLDPGWYFLFPRLFFSSFLESVIFIGFYFRLLRFGRSFLRAAFLSGILFSLSHVTLLLLTPTRVEAVQVLMSMLMSMILSFGSAYVFERTGNNIWGWALISFGLNLIMVVGIRDQESFHNGVSSVYRWIGIVLLAVVVFPLMDWFYPRNEFGIEKPIKQ